MALSATIFKLDLSIADIDRGHYADYALTLARHPSETDQRMLARIIAFAYHADENLQFTKGLSTDEEPDLWQKNLSGELLQWIEFGQIDDKRLRKASHRAEQVAVYTYQSRSARVWWQKFGTTLQSINNLSLWHLPEEALEALTGQVQRSMRWQCTLQEGQLLLSTEHDAFEITRTRWGD